MPRHRGRPLALASGGENLLGSRQRGNRATGGMRADSRIGHRLSLAFAREKEIDLTVVGPEGPLAAGIVDRFREEGLRIFGPTKSASRIESSKEFAKDLMSRHGIPTASYRTFSDFDEALAYIKAGPVPVVIKYDGLAAGKGVVVALTYSEAEDALRDMLLDECFGQGRVVIEEFLDGPEF